MRKILLAAMLLSVSPAMALVTVTPIPAGPIVEDHSDLFDVSQSGTTILGGTGGYPTIDGRDAFGASTPTSAEPGDFIFNDFSYNYGTQVLSFKTAAPVTISGYNLYLAEDAGGARHFNFVRLLGSTDNITFTNLGSYVFSSSSYLAEFGSNNVRVQSTFASQTLQYFMLEAQDTTTASGGRILELDAISGVANPGVVPEPATWAMMLLGFGLVGAASRFHVRDRRAAA